MDTAIEWINSMARGGDNHGERRCFTLFVDGLMHGGSSRRNPIGERRVTIYRYGPLWGATRFGYEYSAELLDRLTPERRKILQPVQPLHPS